jgi:hypothetical protein
MDKEKVHICLVQAYFLFSKYLQPMVGWLHGCRSPQIWIWRVDCNFPHFFHRSTHSRTRHSLFIHPLMHPSHRDLWINPGLYQELRALMSWEQSCFHGWDFHTSEEDKTPTLLKGNCENGFPENVRVLRPVGEVGRKVAEESRTKFSQARVIYRFTGSTCSWFFYFMNIF